MCIARCPQPPLQYRNARKGLLYFNNHAGICRSHLVICGRRGAGGGSRLNLHKHLANCRIPLQLTIECRGSSREGCLRTAQHPTSLQHQSLHWGNFTVQPTERSGRQTEQAALLRSADLHDCCIGGTEAEGEGAFRVAHARSGRFRAFLPAISLLAGKYGKVHRSTQETVHISKGRPSVQD